MDDETILHKIIHFNCSLQEIEEYEKHPNDIIRGFINIMNFKF